MNFDVAFEKLIGHEGGYARAPNDRGNWTTGVIGKGELRGTKYGISAMAYPHEDIAGMTLDRAREIYRADYWDAVQAEYLPDAVRFDLFDAAVNSGVRQAVKWLQLAAKAEPDGTVGPKTLLAVRMADPQLLAKRFNGQRLRFMADLKTWPTFGRGWARRIADNLLEA